MTLAIMQPYLFPYIGYWQLINCVDQFVIYDDVNFIKQGFINRNRILDVNKAQVFTMELIGASSNKLINEIEIGKNKILKTITQNYVKAPYYKTVYPLLEDIMSQKEKNLAKFIGYSLQRVSEYLELKTKFIYSSAVHKDNNLKGQGKVIEICKILDADKYINAIGGTELYSKEVFSQSNIELNFLKTDSIEYEQFGYMFVPYLSIIDILMFNSKEKIVEMLNRYELV